MPSLLDFCAELLTTLESAVERNKSVSIVRYPCTHGLQANRFTILPHVHVYMCSTHTQSA